MSEKRGSGRRRDTLQVPKDRFDEVSHGGRVGAHRLKPRPQVFWKYLILAAVCFVVFSTVGLLVLQGMGGSSSVQKTSSSEQDEQKVPVAKIDKTATVAVLNASDLSTLGDVVSDIITEKQLGDVVLTDDAAQKAQISAVFYKDAADASAAMALGTKLGGVSAYQTADYKNMSARLIVLLAKDYNGPGIKAAQKSANEDVAQDEAAEVAEDDNTDADSAT